MTAVAREKDALFMWRLIYAASRALRELFSCRTKRNIKQSGYSIKRLRTEPFARILSSAGANCMHLTLCITNPFRAKLIYIWCCKPQNNYTLQLLSKFPAEIVCTFQNWKLIQSVCDFWPLAGVSAKSGKKKQKLRNCKSRLSGRSFARAPSSSIGFPPPPPPPTSPRVSGNLSTLESSLSPCPDSKL